ncbi:MAG: alpha-L-fucosidase [bacterium]
MRFLILMLYGFVLMHTAMVAPCEVEKVLPVPTQAQREWQEMELVFFVHFGINTFTDREWGDGREEPAIFNPTEFDANQWAEAVRDAGGKMIILTAKHHDGFCLFPSKYTEHSVKNSPWRDGNGDVVREVADACRKAGLKFGVYLSPWDRNHPEYGNSPVYNQYFLNQLRELLSNYGEIAEVWFDGANGEGPNGKRQVYDWEAYYTLIRELQPNAVVAIVGPDVRWVGNESGVARETEWSVQIVSEEGLNDARIRFNSTLSQGSTKYLADGVKTLKDVAFSHLSQNPEAVEEQAHLIWYPAETDVSIRPGWFYHAAQDDEVKSLEHLVDIYFKSIGRGTVLLLNVPPDQRGLFHENDVQRLQELRQYVDQTFAVNLATGAKVQADSEHGEEFQAALLIDGDRDTSWAAAADKETAGIILHLESEKTFDVIMLQEPIQLGQRIAEFTVEVRTDTGWQEIAQGTTVGYKRLLRVAETSAEQVRIRIRKSRGCPVLHTVGLFKTPERDW